MYCLVDGDVLTYAIPFGLQEGKGDSITLKDGAERFLGSRIDAFIDKILQDNNAQDYKVFLSSKGEDKLKENHRYEYLPDYKGGRVAAKPLLHQEARDYLERQHLAVMSSTGLEADDMIAIEHTQLWERENSPSIICSIDKDFDQLAGWHYKWEMKRAGKIIPAQDYYITEFEGTKNLYLQALTGDKVDNIGYEVKDGKQTKCQYLQGIGPKKAQAILKQCKTEAEMYNACLAVYLQNLMKSGHHDNIELEAETLLQNNLHGLYLIRGFRGSQWKTWKKP